MKVVNEVMVVEDDTITTKLVSLILKKVPEINKVHTFENGKTAIEFFKSEFYNNNKVPLLILLDINMPVMDGWEFLNELNLLNMNVCIPVYMLTSSINPEDKEMADNRTDVHGFISKPLDLYKLLEIMNQIKSGTYIKA